MHFYKKTKNNDYLCDWYLYNDGNFCKFPFKGITITVVGVDDFKRTIPSIKMITDWEDARGVIVSTPAENGYDKFLYITNEDECLNEMLSEGKTIKSSMPDEIKDEAQKHIIDKIM